MQNQFQKGVTTILSALNTALTERAVTGAVVKHDFEGLNARVVTFAITANGQTETQSFTREEIEDSGDAIDAPAAIKVRSLVSHFVR